MPWFVAHGAAIAWLLVAATAIAPIAVIHAVRARRDRSAARADADRFAIALGAPGEGPISVRGVLRDGRAATTGDRHVRGDGLWLEHEGQRVELEGAIRVVRGTAARASWLHRARTFAVATGDFVIVKGSGRRAATSYREQGLIVTGEGSEPIELCAVHPRACARRIHAPWLAALVLALGAGSWLALHELGRHELALAIERARGVQRRPLHWTDPSAVAAMLPGMHREALSVLYVHYRQDLVRGDDNLAARIAIAEDLRGTMRSVVADLHADRIPSACEAGAVELLDQQRFEEALGRACGNDAIDREALLALGRYPEVARRPPNDNPVAAIGAGRWTEAAIALGGSSCAAELMRAFGGELAASERLQARTAESTPCALAAALVLPPERRGAALAAISPGHDAHLARFVADLRWALDPTVTGEPRVDDWFELGAGLHGDSQVFRDDDRSTLRRMWLSALAPASAHDVHAYHALAALDRGDYAGARVETEAAGIAEVTAVLDARERGIGERHHGCAPTQRDNDGRAWADALLHCGESWQFMRSRIQVSAAQVTKHRAELQHAIRVYVADSGAMNGRSGPLGEVHEAALIRDVERAAGDAEQAARWQAIIEAHVAAVTDPDRLLAMLFVTGF